MARQAGRGAARQGRAWQARQGVVRPGEARQARRGTAGPGEARFGRRGEARRGQSWLGRQGEAWRGAARSGRQGEAGHGKARQGRRGRARQAWRGRARRGEAWQARLVIFKQEVLVMEYEMGDVFLAVVVVALASKAALDAWFEGTIFATARAHTEVWKYSDRKGIALIGDLMTCRFCLGYHVCFWLSFLCCFRNYEFVLLVPTALAARAMEYHIELALRRKDDGEA